MARDGILKVAIAVLFVGVAAVSLGGGLVGAQVYHVVGADRGWDPSSDLASWSSDKTFRAGDKMWLAYSTAHGYIAEVKSKEEFESCDVTNPIRMFTDGLDTISMDKEGLRYFASSNVESCKNGLKLHVEVMPQSYQAPEMHNTNVAESEGPALVAANGPTTPSDSAHLTASFVVLSVGLLCYVLGF
ncbi:early nodulin-like protein 2 [Pyrus ussuriensis x Pyrus communis]|uniref:Early nodulin-like protein 2 n=1 Tax=Pyrus ussuriensis x Pyrus communis TaxID=2448454 RepID=A0A5N5FCN3_9ROSA|nr:early nodulin-like protein 2 [Pyrus ussuriensis x Pyrus communis]